MPNNDYKDNTSILATVLWSVFFVPLVSSGLLIEKLLRLRIVFHKKSLGHRSKIVVGILFILWGALMLSVPVTKGESARDTAIASNVITQSVASAADQKDTKETTVMKEEDALVLTYIYSLPFILNGMMLLLYTYLLTMKNRKAREMLSLLNGKVQYIPDLAVRAEVSVKIATWILEEMVVVGIIRDAQIDYLNQKVYIKNDESIKEKKQVAWSCASCGANNKREIEEGEIAVCAYCGSPKL